MYTVDEETLGDDQFVFPDGSMTLEAIDPRLAKYFEVCWSPVRRNLEPKSRFQNFT
jgi:hypothetical protein